MDCDGSGKLSILLFAGVLSVFYAEVLSGASPYWFVDSFGYIFLLPLYMFHLIVLYNIAVRYNRLSIRSLYLFGVIFGLYESWMTKVIWAGFSESEKPIFGTILGIAIGEFGIITLFWHPVMSFIAPLATIEVLSRHLRGRTSGHWTDCMVQRNRVRRVIYIMLAMFSSSALVMGAKSLAGALFGFLGTLAIIYGLYLFIKRRNPQVLSLENLVVGGKALVFMVIYLAIMYLLFFISIRPEDIPSISTIIVTLLIYLIVATLIYLDKPVVGPERKNEHFTTSHIKKFNTLVMTLIILFSLIPEIGFLAMIVIFITLIVFGYIIFIKTTITIIKNRITVQGSKL